MVVAISPRGPDGILPGGTEAARRLELAVNSPTPDMIVLTELKANPFGDPMLEEARFVVLRDRIGAL